MRETRRTARAWLGHMLLTIVALVLVGVACVPGPDAAAEPEPQPRRQVGLASYYGPGFHGEETASGEIFNQRDMTAAHRSLPLGSIVRVTNLENGRSVVLRINDRGPYGRNYRKGTIIDVSRGAARRLRFLEDGLVRVRVDVLRRGRAAGGVE
jgi:rare lipoprotein A